MERLQERDQLGLVPPKDRFDLWRFVRIRDKDLPSLSASISQPGDEQAHLEDVERLELDVLAPVFEQVHHHFQVLLVRDVARHDFEVGPVEQDLAEQLERLPFRHVVR